MKAIIPLLLLNLSAVAATPDRDMKEVLDALEKKHPSPMENLSANEARTQPTPMDAALTLLKKTDHRNVELGKIEEIRIDGASGKIPATVYIPEGRPPFPILVYYHGGGFVVGTNKSYDATAKALAIRTGVIVVAPEYRKAPEHKFPAAHEDAYAAYKWVVKNGTNLGGNRENVAVAGESAGGNLALNVALRARDEKFQRPKHELLIYPVVSSEMNTESYREFAAAKPLGKAEMEWFMKNYLRTPADAKDPRLNLLTANFKDLYDATVITAEIDPLNAEGKLLAEKMRADGLKVDHRNYEGVTHEFFGMSPMVKDARLAQRFAASELREAFGLLQAEEEAQFDRKK